MNMFNNRRLLIATKHSKEIVIAPLLEKELGVSCFVSSNFDTDVLGTFTGDIERQQTPLETVRAKCLKAMELHNCDLGVASEGSFGAHPSLYFIPGDDELVMLIDIKNNLEIVGRALSTSTNFNGTLIYTKQALLEFATQAKFPSHALILKNDATPFLQVYKGITDETSLLHCFNNLLDTYQQAYVETDMRAMYNPTRMEVIKQATEDLLQKIKSVCPSCNTPGYWIMNATKGLPCSCCGMPTKGILSNIYECKSCLYTSEKMYPYGKEYEDPGYCDYCNP